MSSNARPIIDETVSYDPARADYASRRSHPAPGPYDSSGALQLAPAGQSAEFDEAEVRDFVRAIMPDADPDTFERAVALMGGAVKRQPGRNRWEIAGVAGLLPVEEQSCRQCRAPFGDLLDVSGNREAPHRGDVSICQQCADVTIFDVTKRRTIARRAPSALESEQIEGSQQVKAAQIAIRVRAALADSPLGKL